MATRQISANGKQKSPRVQVVLSEDLCERLSALAKKESRTIRNMAKVFIQEGVERSEEENLSTPITSRAPNNTEGFRSALEAQELIRLKGAPRRLRLYRPKSSQQ